MSSAGEAATSTETPQAIVTSDKTSEPVPSTIEKSQAPESAATKTQDATEKPAAAPAQEPSTAPTWPELKDSNPLAKLLAKLPDLLSKSGHDEVYGVPLKPKQESGSPDFATLLILQKFLRADHNDLAKAEDRLLKTLTWRKEFNPIAAMNETFKKDKYDGLGYVTVSDGDDGVKQVITWNIYGAVKDYEKTFTPIEE
jgi:phosphatidylinositol transfer protein SFH5